MHRRIRGLLAMVIVVGFVLGATQRTLAHYVYQQGYVFQRPQSNCTWSRSETSHGNGGGYSKGDTASKTYVAHSWGGAECGADAPRPAGYMKTQLDLYKWTGSYWGLCRRVNWVYNTTNTYWYAIETYYGATPPCGNGTYRTDTHSYVNMTGTWEGGPLNSGDHILP
jgi:hypothetical protein